MRKQKGVFFPSSLLKQRAQKRSGFLDPDAELRVCFQFRVIPETRRSFSKNRQCREMWRKARGRKREEAEGSVVNEHQMLYLRW